MYRLVVAGFISRASRPGSNFDRLSVSHALELMHLERSALVSSPRELQNSLSIASIRPLEHKLWQYRSCKVVRVSHPGFLGLTPWFLVIKMLRSFFKMTTGSNSNGRIHSDEDNTENPSDEDNNKENEMSAASDPKELASSPSNPEEEGDDGAADTGDPLLPRQIFCPSDASMPSSTSAAPRIDPHQPKRSATTVRDKVAEDPNQPCMDCASPLLDVNLLHVKQEEEELGDDGDSCASAAECADLGDATKEALQDQLFTWKQ